MNIVCVYSTYDNKHFDLMKAFVQSLRDTCKYVVKFIFFLLINTSKNQNVSFIICWSFWICLQCFWRPLYCSLVYYDIFVLSFSTYLHFLCPCFILWYLCWKLLQSVDHSWGEAHQFCLCSYMCFRITSSTTEYWLDPQCRGD